MNYDRVDLNILRELRQNARIPNKVLAARVGIAPSTCITRVRRLVDNGAISGFYAEFNPKGVGVGAQNFAGVPTGMPNVGTGSAPKVPVSRHS